MYSASSTAVPANLQRNTTLKDEEGGGVNTPELKVDVNILKDHIKQKFKLMITAIDPESSDSKLLIVDRLHYDLFRSLFTKNELGVSRIAFFNEELRTDLKHLIFVTPPSVQNMNKLATIIRNNPNRYIHLVFLPKRSFACKEALKLNRIEGSITNFHDFNFDLIPLDYDLLSLEIPDTCKLLYFELDTSPLVAIVESIHRLQIVYGKIPSLFGKGYTSKIIQDMLRNVETLEKMKVEENNSSEIDCLVIFDRNCDYVTPLLTQFTYAGSLDEVWGIKQNNFIMLEKKFFPVNSPAVQAENLKEQDTLLHKLKKDKVFMEIRDYHTSVVPQILDKKLVEIKSLNDEIAAGSNKATIKEMTKQVQKERKILEKDFDKVATHVEIRKHLDELMSKPSYYKLIKTEQSIVNGDMKPQEVMDYIETLIGNQESLVKVLKLLCLHSVVENGLKQPVLEGIKKDIILAYGFEHFITLSNLEKAGLLRKETDKKNWDSLSKQLNLVNPDIQNFQDPDDASYAYFGYCPIFVRAVENLFKKDGWNGIKGALDLIPGTMIMEDKRGSAHVTQETKEVVLVYIIGGVTYGELAGFRYLAKKYNKQIIVASTSVLSGDRLISPFMDKSSKV